MHPTIAAEASEATTARSCMRFIAGSSLSMLFADGLDQWMNTADQREDFRERFAGDRDRHVERRHHQRSDPYFLTIDDLLMRWCHVGLGSGLPDEFDLQLGILAQALQIQLSFLERIMLEIVHRQIGQIEAEVADQHPLDLF